MRATVFHNPTAGGGDHDRDNIKAALKLADVDMTYVSTKKNGLKDALKKKTDFFVAAGGDGTIGKILRKMPRRSIPLGIIPLGTANNIARSLGIAGTPQDLIETWRLTESRQFDIGLARCGDTDESFVEAFGVGVFARLLKSHEKDRTAEAAENILGGREALQELLREAKPIDIEIVADGKTIDVEVLGVEVLNTSYTGPGLPLAHADPGDGKLDIVCFEVDLRDAFIEWLDAPQKHPVPAKAIRAAKVELKWSDAPMRLDDQYKNGKGKKRICTLRCEPRPAHILVSKPRAIPKRKAAA